MDFIGGAEGEKKFDDEINKERMKKEQENARDLEDLLVLVRSLSPYEIKALKADLIARREDEKRNFVHPGIAGIPERHNAEKIIPFAPGQPVKVKRSSGEIEDDWTYFSFDADNPGKLVVVKDVIEAGGLKHQLRKSVKLLDLIELNK